MATQNLGLDSSHQEDLPPLPMADELWQAVATSLQLSPQHTRIVELILRGMCDKQITEAMGIHKATLRTYLNRIAVQTGARGRVAIFRLILKVSHDVSK